MEETGSEGPAQGPGYEELMAARGMDTKIGQMLAPLHGANPDDWMLIFRHAYNYVIQHWNGSLVEKRLGLAGSGDSGGDDDRGSEGEKATGGAGVNVKTIQELVSRKQEDFVSDAFVLLALKNPEFRTLGQARAWIARTASNLYSHAVRDVMVAYQGGTSEESLRREDYARRIEPGGHVQAWRINVEHWLGRDLTEEEAYNLEHSLTGDDKKDMKIAEAFVSQLGSGK